MTCKLEFLGKLSSKNSLENNVLTVYQIKMDLTKSIIFSMASRRNKVSEKNIQTFIDELNSDISDFE